MKTLKKELDLFMFMGQSNMAGRGITSTMHPEAAPTILEGAGYEYRTISEPAKLSCIVEPFGVKENNADGIDDGNLKTGSMVTSFVNAYYTETRIPVVGVSASKGGSSIEEWQPGTKYLNDAISRLTSCVSFLETQGYAIRHKYMLWCQGETDGDHSTDACTYKTKFEAMLSAMLDVGIEKCFMVRIGNCNMEDEYDRYKEIISIETKIAQTNKNVVMVSTDFTEMRERGLMKDAFHYYQSAYNETGTCAGSNTAAYVNKEKNYE